MILVVGATGTLGGMITRRLLEQGEQVRILARPHSEYAPLQDAGAEVAFGDLKDPASLDGAVDGVDYVITTANSAVRGGDDNVQNVEIQGNRNLVDAARRAGVKQFVFTSALGASPDSPAEFLRGKAAAEEHLRASGVPFTILVPNIFMEIWIGMIVGMPLQNGQPVTIIGEGQRKHSFVSMDDVAAFAVAAVGNPAALGQSLVIGGPEAVSWSEIVERTGRLLGQQIPMQHLPMGESVPGLPDTVNQLLTGMNTYDSPIDMDETARTYGVSPTPVEAYLQRTFQ